MFHKMLRATGIFRITNTINVPVEQVQKVNLRQIQILIHPDAAAVLPVLRVTPAEEAPPMHQFIIAVHLPDRITHIPLLPAVVQARDLAVPTAPLPEVPAVDHQVVVVEGLQEADDKIYIVRYSS